MCLGPPNSSYLADACTPQLDELPLAFSDALFDYAVTLYELPQDFFHRSSEVSATTFAAAVDVDANPVLILTPNCVYLQQATPTSSSCSDRSSVDPIFIQGAQSS